MGQVFTHDLHSLQARFTRLLDRSVNWAFAFSQAGSQRRRFALLALAVLVWLGLALLLHPIHLGMDPLLDQLIYALFAANVVRRMLILWLAFFIGSRLSAVFVDDIFELRDISVAQNFLQTAAFSGRYEGLSIREGGVAGANQKSPIFRIGGPGVVDASLENAALFEKPNGKPHVVGLPNQRVAILDGFERLRAIIDLRDQFVDLTVEGRTQDGIPVVAKDVRLVYSIYRGPQAAGQPEHFQQPYPFKEEAVLNLVYKQDTSPLLKAMVGSIRGELGAFISKHTLSEFLTNADDSNEFISRDQITNLFYDYAKEFTQKAETRGVELKWIGVGTWVVPAQVIPGKQLDAWKLSARARLNQNVYVLARQRAESRLTELLRLVDEVPSLYYSMSGETLLPGQVANRLLLDYREKLHNAYDLYVNAGEPVPPELDLVIHHLTRLTAIRLGGQA
ncbi:MAG TPA: SPFH domain-containing protein [Anaerolineales bacterium]